MAMKKWMRLKLSLPNSSAYVMQTGTITLARSLLWDFIPKHLVMQERMSVGWISTTWGCVLWTTESEGKLGQTFMCSYICGSSFKTNKLFSWGGGWLLKIPAVSQCQVDTVCELLSAELLKDHFCSGPEEAVSVVEQQHLGRLKYQCRSIYGNIASSSEAMLFKPYCYTQTLTAVTVMASALST